MLYELLVAYKDKFKSREFEYEVHELLQVVCFRDFRKNEELFYRIVKVIDRDDELLLRTLLLFVKSRMLWSNRCFGEDAIANVFFALEGALHLLQQKKKGKDDAKLDWEFLASLFESTFRSGAKRHSVLLPLCLLGVN